MSRRVWPRVIGVCVAGLIVGSLIPTGLTMVDSPPVVHIPGATVTVDGTTSTNPVTWDHLACIGATPQTLPKVLRNFSPNDTLVMVDDTRDDVESPVLYPVDVHTTLPIDGVCQVTP